MLRPHKKPTSAQRQYMQAEKEAVGQQRNVTKASAHEQLRRQEVVAEMHKRERYKEANDALLARTILTRALDGAEGWQEEARRFLKIED